MTKAVGVSTKPKASAADPANRWEQRETVAKILSLIAIPIVLAIVGWLVQSSLSARSASQEYVKLSVSILKEPKDKVELSLRSWAADLLNANAPTKLTSGAPSTKRRYGDASSPTDSNSRHCG
jgi:cytochrome b561